MKRIILGIETSCDETAISLISAKSRNSHGRSRGTIGFPKFKVLKNLVSSQVKIHAPFGGVVPNLAKREHIKNLPILLRKLLVIPRSQFPISKQIKISKSQIPTIDMIAVTVGPGLEPALWTGINFAKELAKKLKMPLVGTNHLEGHLYSFLLPQKSKSQVAIRKASFPAIALIVSGGHTILLKMDSLTKWKKLGETRDDAVGEAFDKVARLLGLPYPGGPEIETLARKGTLDAINFPRPMLHDTSYDFSFSGLKTAVLYYLRDHRLASKTYTPPLTTRGGPPPAKGIADLRKRRMRLWSMPRAGKPNIAASFQQAAIEVLVAKTMRAAKEFSAKSIMLSGGVAANRALRKVFAREAKKIGARFLVSDPRFNTDNAAMIAVAGYLTYLRSKRRRLIAKGDMNI